MTIFRKQQTNCSAETVIGLGDADEYWGVRGPIAGYNARSTVNRELVLPLASARGGSVVPPPRKQDRLRSKPGNSRRSTASNLPTYPVRAGCAITKCVPPGLVSRSCSLATH